LKRNNFLKTSLLIDSEINETPTKKNIQNIKNFMKKEFKTLIVTLILSLTATIIFAQDPREQEIRRLEELERLSAQSGDSAVLFGKIWSKDMVINAPANRVGTVEGTKMQLRTGNLAYASFVRNIEKITFNDNITIVIGEEILKPQGKQMNANKTVTRRFTNIWKFSNNQWQIIGRQATIIKIAPTDAYKKQVLYQIDSLMNYHERLILTQDTVAMRKFNPDDLVITNPFGQMIGKEKMIERVKSGIIKYSKYEKTIEHFAMEGDNVAIVIGKEDVTPTTDANRADAGIAHERRFTEVWFLRDGNWKRTVRHASTF
jgi:Domain of unknown function (DUF4440)